jgi:Domain of unknown function (DUF5667)
MRRMKTEHDIERMLTESRPTLDVSSRARLWSRIEAKLATARPTRSPFLFSFVQTRSMITRIVMFTVLISTGGVALAAETARPGDLLFPIERAFENARLTVARSPEKKDVLLKQYSDERLEELREIIEEEIRFRKVDEDRSSRLKDRGEDELSNEGSVRVGSALTEVLTFIDESEDDDDDTAAFLRELRTEIEGLNVTIDDERVKERAAKSRFEWKTDDDSDEQDDDTDENVKKHEWRNEEARVRIEERNGRVRIDLKEDDDWDDDRDDHDDSEERNDVDDVDNSSDSRSDRDDDSQSDKKDDSDIDRDDDREDRDTDDDSGDNSDSGSDEDEN